jgi:hypothetical protein
VPADTRRFDQQNKDNTASRREDVIDRGMPRPWRISLWIAHKEEAEIIELVGAMILGRKTRGGSVFPDLDLGPYNAEEMGVSRQHLMLKQDEDRIMVMDMESANGTKLNDEWLTPNQLYPLRHGDELTLGTMTIKVELLMDPFS